LNYITKEIKQIFQNYREEFHAKEMDQLGPKEEFHKEEKVFRKVANNL
jgi:hypothetical protein